MTSLVKNDIVLKAMWTDIHYNIYNVTFLDYDDKVLSKQEVEEGQNATPPSDPTRFGYIFVGWDISYEKINSDREIHAVYEIDKSKEYTISYNLNGGQWDYQTKTEYINDFLKDFYSFIAPRESLSVFMHGEGKLDF